MTVLKFGTLSVAIAMCLALPGMAQSGNVKIKGVSLGMTLEQAADILTADGYNVRIRSVTFEVAPDDPLEVTLFAQKNVVGESRDSITIRTSEHPTISRVAAINRRVIYEQRSGPIYSVYDNALRNLIGGKPAYDHPREISLSRQTAYQLGYEWNAAGSFKAPSLLHRLAQNDAPLCVRATDLARQNIVDLNKNHEASTPYVLNQNGIYNATRPGTYAENCHAALWATAIISDETQVVNEFRQTFIDHEMIDADAAELEAWLSVKQVETEANRARDRGVPDL